MWVGTTTEDLILQRHGKERHRDESIYIRKVDVQQVSNFGNGLY